MLINTHSRSAIQLTTFSVLLSLFTLVNVGLCQRPDLESKLCQDYAKAISELDQKYSEHMKTGRKLIGERMDVFDRLSDSKKEIAKLVDASVYSSIELAQAELAAMSIQSEANSIISAQSAQGPAARNIDVRLDPAAQLRLMYPAVYGTNDQKAIASLAQQNTDIQVYYDMVRHHMKTLNEASKLVAERHMSQLRELQAIVKDMSAWEKSNLDFFERYWELADVANVKSDLELQSALTQLATSDDQNPGAIFAKAVTFARLEQFDESLKQIERLKDVQVLQTVLLALKAEILTRTDKKRDAANLLRQTVRQGLNDPRMRMHRAMALAADGQLRKAELELEAVVKLGGHSIASHRGIAFINGSNPKPTSKIKSKAMENAVLVNQLAGDDWACKIALALAFATNGDWDNAIRCAEEANELAIGTNHEFCQNVLEQLIAKQQPSWRF